jgi:predicted acyltransferase
MTTAPASTTPFPEPVVSPVVPKAPIGRLMSVDALRGFDMFWILGADALVYALRRLSPSRPTEFLADQLEHADWAGFHFYDLIFPLFVFLMGVSVVFSLTKTIQRGGRAEAIKRVVRRGVLLFVIGILYSGGFAKSWPDMRLMGVLNRIALAYLFGGLLFCFFKPRVLVSICAALLIGYWAIMTFVPIRDIQLTRSNIAALAEKAGDQKTADYFYDRYSPNPSAVKNSPAWAGAQRLFYSTTNYVTAKYDKGYNLSDHLDFQYLPGKKYDTFFDPEGFLSTIPAVASCLLGIFAGFLLMNAEIGNQRKVILLLVAGVISATLGWCWNLQFPVAKKIWTSSFVLVAGGYSAILLGVFHQIVEVWNKRAWCQPFVWIGMNSITIYLVKNIIGGEFRQLASRFVGGDIKTFFDAHVARGVGDVLISVVGLLLAFWFVRFLYKRQIFLRL